MIALYLHVHVKHHLHYSMYTTSFFQCAISKRSVWHVDEANYYMHFYLKCTVILSTLIPSLIPRPSYKSMRLINPIIFYIQCMPCSLSAEIHKSTSNEEPSASASKDELEAIGIAPATSNGKNFIITEIYSCSLTHLYTCIL